MTELNIQLETGQETEQDLRLSLEQAEGWYSYKCLNIYTMFCCRWTRFLFSVFTFFNVKQKEPSEAQKTTMTTWLRDE